MRRLLLILALASCRPERQPEVIRLRPSPVLYLWDHEADEPQILSTKPVSYRLRALWRFEGGWKPIPVSGEPVRLEGTPVAMRFAVGTPLGEGLYHAVAIIDGEPACQLVFAGDTMCNDIALGPPPTDEIATCVPMGDVAAARFVPDPKKLDWVCGALQ